GGLDIDGGWRHVGVLRHRHVRYGQEAGQGDAQGNDASKDWAIDEKQRHAYSSTLGRGLGTGAVATALRRRPTLLGAALGTGLTTRAGPLRTRLGTGVPGHGLYRGARTDLLEAFDHHHVAGIQALVDQRLAFDLRAHRNRHRIHDTLANHHERVQAVGRALDRLHWHEQGVFVDTLLHAYPDIHSRKQDLIRVVDFAAQCDLGR